MSVTARFNDEAIIITKKNKATCQETMCRIDLSNPEIRSLIKQLQKILNKLENHDLPKMSVASFYRADCGHHTKNHVEKQ